MVTFLIACNYSRLGDEVNAELNYSVAGIETDTCPVTDSPFKLSAE